jgi:hypothetical protein
MPRKNKSDEKSILVVRFLLISFMICNGFLSAEYIRNWIFFALIKEQPEDAVEEIALV